MWDINNLVTHISNLYFDGNAAGNPSYIDTIYFPYQAGFISFAPNGLWIDNVQIVNSAGNAISVASGEPGLFLDTINTKNSRLDGIKSGATGFESGIT